MEFRQLEHFVAVAGEMSFSRAAERAHVVQSALSTSIAKLERELGVELFDRSRQRIKLTAAGEHFRVDAQEILQSARRAKDSLGVYRGSLSGTVEFGSLISFGALDVPKALGDFRRAHPHVRLSMRLGQAGASSYLDAIAEGALDLALVSVPNRFPAQLDMRLLFEEPMMFVCRADHGLGSRRRVNLAELAQEDLIGFPPGFGLRQLTDDAFRVAGVEATTQYEVPAGFSDVAELVRNGLGTTFMPLSEAQRFPDLRALKPAAPILWQVFLVSRPPAVTSPATARLAETLLEASEELRTSARR